MAYGTKYSLAYDAVESPSNDVATYLLTFDLDGYSGSLIPLSYGGASPVVAKIKNNQDSTIGIKEKQLDIEILENIDLSELQRAKPKQWKVTHYRTVGSTTTVDFKGWLVPTNSGTEYVDGDKYVRLEANDGLEFLKNTDFVDDIGKYYEGLTSIFEIVRLCLDKTGLGLNINTINNTYALGNAQNDSDEALKQRYIDIDLYRGENEPFVTYKVLEQILLSEKCRISQEDGEWWFENTTEKRTGFVKSRKYQSNGTFISGGTLDLRVAALHGSNFQPMAGGETSSVPANKWVKAKHKLGKFKSRLENRDFSNIFVGDLVAWSKTVNPTPNVSRVGDGTPTNPYGAKLTGVFSKNKDTGYLYQDVLLASTTIGNLQQALNTNIIFSGEAYTQDVDHALVSLVVRIKTSAFVYNGSTNIPETNTIHSLGDTGEWESQTYIELENKDVNNHSKKSAKSWEVISKRIGDITIPYGKSGRLGGGAWNPHVTEVSVSVRLHSGVGELEPSPGETKSCAVWYKKPFLSFVNTDTNRNLREINYKATQSGYAPNDETFEVAYGDYVDGSNLSALKYADGSLTKLWTSESDNSPKNFHVLGVVDMLDETGGTPKVYDGTIWGLIKFRHSVELAGFTNRGYIVGYSYDYATSMADVRIIEHQDTANITTKKTGVLSDGTEIDMISDSAPSPIMGNGVGGGALTAASWLQQILNGILGYNSDEDPISVLWNNPTSEDAFDFGSIVRRVDKLAIGSNDDNIELGNEENKTLVKLLGGSMQLGQKVTFYEYLVTDGDDTEQYNVGIDAWNVHFEGSIEVVDVLSVGQGAVIIQKKLEENGEVSYAEIGGANYINVTAPEINILNTLGVNVIESVTDLPIQVNSEVNFNFPIYITDSEAANSAISRAVLTQTIQDLALAENYWKVGGNVDVTGDMVFDIVSKYDNVGGTLVQQPPYDYLWNINGANKMQLTAEGNLSVGGIAPEAVIHAHAKVVGNAEVVSMKVTNQTSENFFSIAINSENSRTSLYASGEVWATTISKFKFGAADISGLFNFSVLPQVSADATLGNQLVRLSQVQSLLSGGFSVSTACKLVFDTNQSLSGAKTQGGYTTITGDNALFVGQANGTQNGVYVYDGTNWARNTANDTDPEIRGKGHLITHGTFAGTQWVNNNSSAITIGTTAITYVQWSGAELDPVWEAYKTANDLTPTRFGNWNTAFGWGNHANLYVDKVSGQNNIAGAKVFTTSIQSPIVKAGTDALNITMSNISGTAPRVASNSTLDFAATTKFDWLTTGNIGRMRLTTTGLRVGSTTDPLFKLHVSGTTGLEGLISLGNTSQNIAMSSGAVGQFIRRSFVSNGFYNVDVNEWANITTADVTGLSTNYQAKLNGIGFVKMDGAEVTYEQYSEFGRYLNSFDNFNIFDAPYGASYVAGLVTNLPNGQYLGHSIKMSLGQDRPNDVTFLAFGLPRADFDGKLYARGVYEGEDTGWKPIGGDIANYTVYREEAEIELKGYYYEFTEGDKAVFAGIDKTHGTYDILMRSANNNNDIPNDYRNYIDTDGRWYFQNGTNEAQKYLLAGEVSGGGGASYTVAEPLYFVDSEIRIKEASASQTGVLTAAKFIEFSGKLSDGGTVNTSLNFATGSALYFGQNPSDIYSSDARINCYDYTGDSIKDLVLYTQLSAANIVLAPNSGSVIIKRVETPPTADILFTEAFIGQNMSNSIINLNGVNFNFQLPFSGLPDGQRFNFRYFASTNTIRLALI